MTSNIIENAEALGQKLRAENGLLTAVGIIKEFITNKTNNHLHNLQQSVG